MELKPKESIFNEIKKQLYFDGYLKGTSLKSSLSEMKKIQNFIHFKISIWFLATAVYGIFIYFLMNSPSWAGFLAKHELHKSMAFIIAYFGIMGITGLLLLHFSDKALRKRRQIRSLHLLPEAFSSLEDDRTYRLYLSIKTRFNESKDKKNLDTWIILSEVNSPFYLATIDHSWLKSSLKTKQGKVQYSSLQKVISFAEIRNADEKSKNDFIRSIISLDKKMEHPEFPGNLSEEIIFENGPNYFREIEPSKMMNLISKMNSLQK